MMTNRMIGRSGTTDTELVAQSLDGDRDAFGQIISRYQSLVCSLAYSATGSLGQSEDLAQETFITAWKRLGHLRERDKLRAWLCGIARFLIGKALRRDGREPTHAAAPLNAADESPAPELLPSEHTINKEEEGILWRSLERIPETYREALVLFYREHQSIEAVARSLDLSEDAVKQRLSRGRKLLQEQVLAFVEGALERTNPGKAFTLGVVAALPLLATTAKAAAATVTATKAGSAAKAATGTGMLSAFLSGGMMLIVSLFGVFGFFGRWVGRKMGRISQQSPLGRKRIVQFWRTLAIGFLVFVLPPMLVPDSLVPSHPWLFRAQTWSLSAFYWLVAAALVLWVWRRRQDPSRAEAEPTETTRTTSKSYNVWVTLGMLGPAFILGTFLFALFFSNWTLSSKYIPEAEARSIISERKDARFTVYQYRDESKSLEIALPENHRISLTTPLNDSLLLALTEKSIPCQPLIEDQDFHNGGVRGWLVLLSTFVVVAGTVLLLRRPGTQKFYQQEIATPRAELREKRIIAVCAALAMIAVGLLGALFAIKRTGHPISGAEVGRVITENKAAWFEVYQFDKGPKELWITLPKSGWYHPTFIAPADEPTITLLAENNISYRTYVQGRDFGYRGPSRWLSLLCTFILTASAVIVLWWVVKKSRSLPSPAASSL